MIVIEPSRSFYSKWECSSTIGAVQNLWSKLELLLSESVHVEVLFAIELVVREMLVNAVVHGNKADPAKKIALNMQLWSHFLLLEIADEGFGFDWQHRLTKPLNDNDTRGRGLNIASIYALDIRYSQNGSNVKVWFKNIRKGDT